MEIKQPFERKLIEKEIELGFLYIPSKARAAFPNENSKVEVFLGESEESGLYSYNSTHYRLFGLTSWYVSNNANPKDTVEIEVIDFGRFRLKYSETALEDFEPEVAYDDEEVEEIVDLSSLPSSTKGDIVEDRIKDTLLLYGQGLLSVYRPVVDTRGIDLIVVKQGIFQPIFLQVKSRFTLHGTGEGSFVCDIREKTFTAHHSFYIVGAYFDPKELELWDSILFIPTQVVPHLSTRVRSKGETRYRVTTVLSDKTKSKWAPYIIQKKELAGAVLRKFKEMEVYIK